MSAGAFDPPLAPEGGAGDDDGWVAGAADGEMQTAAHHLHRCEPGPALLVPEDLQQLLRAYSESRAMRTRAADPSRRRPKRSRAPPAVQPPARRRRGAGGAHAGAAGVSSESASEDFEADPANTYHAGAGDAAAGNPQQDAVDERPHILAAMHFYQRHITQVLGAALGVPVPVFVPPSQFRSVASVGSGSAVALV